MIWVGLPQLLIFPLVPRLMNRFDLRAQFHDFEIGAYINAYRPVVRERVQTLATTFVNKGYDAVSSAGRLNRWRIMVLSPSTSKRVVALL
jgi:hypothetical protein